MLIDNVVLHELSNKNNISISYLIKKFINNVDQYNFKCEDENELSFVGLVDVKTALKELWSTRSKILKDAYDLVLDKNMVFVNGSLILQKYENLKSTKEIQNNEVKLSKTMSYILRHEAKELGIQMDDNARILLSDLLAQPEFENVSFDMIKKIVDDNNKKRFEIETINGNLMIRAVQGHSKEFNEIIDETKLMEEIRVPLEKCIHGTNEKAWEIIKYEGIKTQSRMHIHCAISEPEDRQVISGMRLDTNVMIYVDMEKAMNDGIKFYLSKNKVILTNGKNGILEPKYFKKVIK